MGATREQIINHAKRHADPHEPIHQRMAMISHRMEHWAEEPVGAEMDELVDAYGSMFAEHEINSDREQSDNNEQASAVEYPVANAENVHPASLHSQQNAQVSSNEPEKEDDLDLSTMQRKLQRMNIEQDNMFEPLQQLESNETGKKMKPRVTFSHEPYKSAHTHGLFSSGHVKESKSLTEIKLTMMNIENRLQVLRANAKFDATHPEVQRAMLLVDQSLQP